MADITVKKTTYEVEGCTEPCYEVTNGYVLVRIATMYHYLGKNTLIIKEYHDGEYQASDEWTGDFKALTEAKAKDIARKFSVYL